MRSTRTTDWDTPSARRRLQFTLARAATGAAWLLASVLVLVVFGALLVQVDNALMPIGIRSRENFLASIGANELKIAVRSANIALAASVLTIAFSLALIRLLQKLPWVVVPLLATFFSLDPVWRSHSFDRLSSKTADWVGFNVGWEISAYYQYLLSAASLALIYLPIIGIGLFSSASAAHREPPYANRLSDAELSILHYAPLIISRIPYIITFAFMIFLFDPWVVKVVTGARNDFIGPLIIQRAFQGGSLHGAAELVLLATATVAIVYVALLLLSAAATTALRKISPTAIAPAMAKFRIGNLRWLASIVFGLLAAAALFLLLFPILKLLADLWHTDESCQPSRDIVEQTISTLVVALFVGVGSSTIAVSLLSDGRLAGAMGGYRIPYLVVALTPEVVLVFLLGWLTFSGAVSKSFIFGSAFFLVTFVPIAVLLFLRSTDHARCSKVDLIGAISAHNPWRATGIALSEFRFSVALVASVIAWLVAENVMMADWSFPPGWKMYSAGALARGGKGV